MRKESQVKSRLRPNSILFNAYPPERYKIESGSKRKVFVRFGIEKIGINKFEFYTVLFLGKATYRIESIPLMNINPKIIHNINKTFSLFIRFPQINHNGLV